MKGPASLDMLTLMRIVLFALLMAGILPAACEFEMVIRNGHVIDPANRRDGRFDVAIANGKIALVPRPIAANPTSDR